MTRTASWEKGEGAVCASQMYVRTAQVDCPLPGRCRSEVAGYRSAGSYSRPVQIDGDAVSMTEGGYPKLQGLGEGKSGPGLMKLWSPKQQARHGSLSNLSRCYWKADVPCAFFASLSPARPLSLCLSRSYHGSHSAHRRDPKASKA